MKPASFRYFDPGSLEEAFQLLAEHGDEAKVIAGGQSLMPLINMRLLRPGVLIDLNRITSLAGIRREGDRLVVGALTRQREVERSPLVQECCPMLSEALSYVGHLAIRSRGTVGGSVAHADPAAELPAVVCALGAEIELTGPDGVRILVPEEFFLTYLTTTLEPGEILTALRFPVIPANTGQAYREVSRRHGDFALAGAAAEITLGENGRIHHAALGLTGVGPTPLRAAAAEALLVGKPPEERLFGEAAAAVAEEIEPDSDLHASADYRRHLASVMAQEALSLAASRARREGNA